MEPITNRAVLFMEAVALSGWNKKALISYMHRREYRWEDWTVWGVWVAISRRSHGSAVFASQSSDTGVRDT